MPKYAVQPQWRSRRAAIGKKGELDFELLMDSEVVTLNKNPTKQRSEPTSPNTVASTFASSPTTVATNFMADVPEMKPLPGAWVTVGKGGRPVRESLMYDEPTKMDAKKKKKKRVRARKATDADDSLHEYLAGLEERPSSSKCLQALGRSSDLRHKSVLKGKETKYWKEYQQAKQLKLLARDSLIAALADGGMLGDSEEKVSAPEPIRWRNDKGSSRGAKLRRKARFAAAAARCYSVEMIEDDLTADVPKDLGAKVDAGWSQLRATTADAMAARGSSLTAEEEEAPTGTTKRECRLSKDSEFSSASSEVASAQQHASSGPSSLNATHSKAKRNSKQCSVM